MFPTGIHDGADEYDSDHYQVYRYTNKTEKLPCFQEALAAGASYDRAKAFDSEMKKLIQWLSSHAHVPAERLGKPECFPGGWIKMQYRYSVDCTPIPMKGDNFRSWKPATHGTNVYTLPALLADQCPPGDADNRWFVHGSDPEVHKTDTRNKACGYLQYVDLFQDKTFWTVLIECLVDRNSDSETYCKRHPTRSDQWQAHVEGVYLTSVWIWRGPIQQIEKNSMIHFNYIREWTYPSRMQPTIVKERVDRNGNTPAHGREVAKVAAVQAPAPPTSGGDQRNNPVVFAPSTTDSPIAPGGGSSGDADPPPNPWGTQWDKDTWKQPCAKNKFGNDPENIQKISLYWLVHPGS